MPHIELPRPFRIVALGVFPEHYLAFFRRLRCLFIHDSASANSLTKLDRCEAVYVTLRRNVSSSPSAIRKSPCIRKMSRRIQPMLGMPHIVATITTPSRAKPVEQQLPRRTEQ
jgi:hypothetical protein